MTRALSACVLAVALAVARPAPAAAQSKTALSWVREPGAESCIAATELGQRVERIVGPVLVPAPEGQISIEGRIAKQDAGFVATVTVSDAAGQILGRREVRSENRDCRAFDDQLAFVIAVAIDPDAALAELPGEFSQDDQPGERLLADMRANPPKPRPPEHAAGPPRRPARITNRADDRGIVLGGSVGAGVAASAGLLPAFGVGFGADAALYTGTWSHRVRGVFWVPQRERLAASAEVDFDAFELELVTCPQLWASGDLDLALCAGAAAARLSVEPVGFAGVARDRWLFGPMLDARFALRIGGRWWAVLSASGQTLWPRDQIVYEQAQTENTLHRVAPVIGAAAISIELRF